MNDKFDISLIYNMTEPTIWIGFDIPGRECGGTYTVYDYKSLPEIKIMDEFKNIDTIDKVKHNQAMLEKMIPSVTSCYFTFEDNLFYCDQQGCVLWYYHSDIGVYCDNDKSSVVARSLPEFLTRLYLETSIWHKHFITRDHMTKAEEAYMAHYKV